MIRPPSTRALVRAEHRPRAARRALAWPVLALVLLGLLGAGGWAQQRASLAWQARLDALDAENRSLRDAQEQTALAQRERQASEAQLLRRLDELAAQNKRLQTELSFFRQQEKRH